MSKEMSVIALGLWVVVLPYLGIYRSWLVICMLVTGIALMVLGFLMRGEAMQKEQHHNPKAPRPARKSHINFEESTPAESPHSTAEEPQNFSSSN